MESCFSIITKLREYPVSKLLAKLDPPLIKTEYIPYNTLYEYLVLIYCYETAKGPRRQFF